MSNVFFNKELIDKCTKITKWEQFCLYFINSSTFIDEKRFTKVKVVYKEFRKKIYIIDVIPQAPLHPMCRCVINAKYK